MKTDFLIDSSLGYSIECFFLQAKKFMTLDQLVCDEEFPDCSKLLVACTPNQVSLICDCKGNISFIVFLFLLIYKMGFHLARLFASC